MSLTSAMNTAQSIFNNTGAQTEVISRNIANVGNANYVKRTAILGTTMYGADVVQYGRAQNDSLLRQTIASTSLFSGQRTLLNGLGEMKSIFGGNAYEASPQVYIGALRDSLESYAAKPGDAALASTAVTSAVDVANTLNSASVELQAMRQRADKDMVLQVQELNALLAKFEEANTSVKIATALGNNPGDAMDARETLLKQISSIVGVTAVTRENQDMALYTAGGTTLFEVIPRKVTMAPQVGFDATTVGNPIYIDGVAVKPGTGNNTTATGSLASLLQLRDDLIPTMQGQLDEVARGLVTMFGEQNPLVPADPMRPGLFTYGTPAATTLPAAGVISAGLAASIRVNPSLIIAEGGNPELLRDGINFDYNTANETGYAARLNQYVTSFDEPMVFDSATRIDTNSSILNYATNSMGWLEQERSGATAADEAKTALFERASSAYSNNTAVSLDEELSLLLDIEQSYKAATKLVTTIDEMLETLMGMVR
jgi:flagellar hook-associated protein 1 FlgK